MQMLITVLIAAAITACLAGCSRAESNGGKDTIVWQGKGANWSYAIQLVHKPNDQVAFVSHGPEPPKPCKAPDYAVEMSEGFVYAGSHGQHYTSFQASMTGIPSFLPGVSTMSQGGLTGLEKGKAYGGMSQSRCFTEEQWKHMQQDTSSTMTITVTALPDDKKDTNRESFSLQTASG